jgi:hypothetical protein
MRKFFQHTLPALGEDKFGMPAIFRAPLSFDQSFLGHLIDQNDHATGQDPEPLRERLLVAGRSPGNKTQDSTVLRRKPQNIDSLGKALGGMCAEYNSFYE